jgi:hypothetical protein
MALVVAGRGATGAGRRRFADEHEFPFVFSGPRDLGRCLFGLSRVLGCGRGVATGTGSMAAGWGLESFILGPLHAPKHFALEWTMAAKVVC